MPRTAGCLTARGSAIFYKQREHARRVIVRCEMRQPV